MARAKRNANGRSLPDTKTVLRSGRHPASLPLCPSRSTCSDPASSCASSTVSFTRSRYLQQGQGGRELQQRQGTDVSADRWCAKGKAQLWLLTTAAMQAGTGRNRQEQESASPRVSWMCGEGWRVGPEAASQQGAPNLEPVLAGQRHHINPKPSPLQRRRYSRLLVAKWCEVV